MAVAVGVAHLCRAGQLHLRHLVGHRDDLSLRVAAALSGRQPDGIAGGEIGKHSGGGGGLAVVVLNGQWFVGGGGGLAVVVLNGLWVVFHCGWRRR